MIAALRTTQSFIKWQQLDCCLPYACYLLECIVNSKTIITFSLIIYHSSRLSIENAYSLIEKKNPFWKWHQTDYGI